MKFITPTILAAILAGSSAIAFAQGPNQPDPGASRGGRPGGPDGHHPPPSPLFEALDLNHDGVISADEIAKASESLKKLDRNGDGQLTHDELRPPRPEGEHDRPPQGGPGPQTGARPSPQPSPSTTRP